MGFKVYDYRTVNRNVLVTPEIRARLYHMQPGQVDQRHSHDLGHEVFLILEGRAEFEIDGTRQELGPGQMCVARVDEIHQVRNLLPDKPTIMYLSVTPHIQPTHTGRTDDDQKLPPRFTPNSYYDDPTDMDVDIADLLEKELNEMRHTADVALRAVADQEAAAAYLRDALDKGDFEAAVVARNAMWDAIYMLHKQVYALGDSWNEFAPRIPTAEETE